MSKLARHESGQGQVFVISVIVIVVVIAAGIITWQLTKKKSNSPVDNNKSSSLSSTNKSVASSACLKALNSSSFCSFASHTDINSQQYVANGTATDSAGTTSSYSVQNDGKGNTDVTYGSDGKQISAVTLDGSTYIQSGAGTTWLEYSGSALGATATVPNPVSGFNLNFTSDIPKGVSVSSEGTAACGNLSCQKYKVSVTSTPDATQYVYFDTNDYLLRQWTYSDSSSGISVNLTFSYHSVVITKPSPVQQIST